MSEQLEQQIPTVNLVLNLEQVNFVQAALGKLPTETGAWIVRQIIAGQVNPQVEALQAQQPEQTEPNTDAPETVQ